MLPSVTERNHFELLIMKISHYVVEIKIKQGGTGMHSQFSLVPREVQISLKVRACDV